MLVSRSVCYGISGNFFGPELPFKFLDKTAVFGQFKVGFKVGPNLFGTKLSQNETPKVSVFFVFDSYK